MTSSVQACAPPQRRQDGAALVFVVLLQLALLLVAHGVLVSALAELSASRAALRQVRSRAAAQAAVHLALRGWGAAALDSVPLEAAHQLGTLPLGDAWGAGALQRLDAESWLLEGTGWISGAARTRLATLAWAPDPGARVAALPAALNLGPGATATLLGSVDASDPIGVRPPLTAADCAPWLGTLALRYASAPLTQMATPTDSVGAPRLGRIDFDALLAAGLIPVTRFGTPTPIERLGACVRSDPWNWGDPERPWRACGAHLPARVARGDLTVRGGVGQGLLVVDGDLTLTGAARFYGLVLIRGALSVEGGAHLEGLAWARDGARVEGLASVGASACWAVRALAAQRSSLGRLRAIHDLGPVAPR